MIPEGWKLAVIDPEGNVVDTVDIGDYDLRKTLAAVEVGNEVMRAVERS